MRRLAALLMMVAAACGDDGGNKKVDAGVQDDAPVTPDAPMSNLVKITVKFDGQPMVGVRVHFQNADSTLITSADTDSTGVATADMPNGGFVTAIDPFAGAFGLPESRVYTYAGVKPGDELDLSERTLGASTQYQVTGPIDTDGNVASYRFSSPCDAEEVA